MQIVRTPLRTPQANRVADRFVRTVRSEYLDGRLIPNQHHLEQILKTPVRAPQANAFCERLIGTIRREYLDFVIPLNERDVRSDLRTTTMTEFVEHYHLERNQQGLANELIEPEPAVKDPCARIRRRQRPGGLLNYYCRAA